MVTVCTVVMCPSRCHVMYSIPLRNGAALVVTVGFDGFTVDMIG